MKVTLKKDHTHAGKPCKAGDDIEVNAADAQWLADHKVIDAPAGGAAAPAAKEK